jgi:trans-aconitate 2-methyltransferase
VAVWDPNQYLRFSEPRLQPAIDLLARIRLPDLNHIYDLGCGTGNVTRLLQQQWPHSVITGIDSSQSMLAQAEESGSGIRWVCQDLEAWRPAESADLIFSNAALHWLPRHDELFPRLVSMLARDGVLAVQMPSNFSAPSHTLFTHVALAGSWRPRLESLMRPPPVASSSHYYQLLAPLAQAVEVWETEYLQVLAGPDPVKEWMKGAWIKPALDALDGGTRQAFETEYARQLRAAYPPMDNGLTLFPFKRLFLIARR